MRTGARPKFCHNPSVRRFFSVCLLLLLPLQFAFAAAAPYCALEKVKAPSHFGHHEHADVPAPAPVDQGDERVNLDNCGVCHLGSAQVHPVVASIPVLLPVVTMRPLLDDRQPQHLQEPTERPPRISLA